MGMLEESSGTKGGYCVQNDFSLSLEAIRIIYLLEWQSQSVVVF